MHSHSPSIHVSINMFNTIFCNPGRFLSLYFLTSCRHFGICWQKWQLAFVSERFSSPKSSKLLVLPLSISAIYHDKRPSFLAQNYKLRLQFTYLYAITSSINSSLSQPSYSISLIFWILVNCLMCLPTCLASVVHLTLSLFIPDKLGKSERRRVRDTFHW